MTISINMTTELELSVPARLFDGEQGQKRRLAAHYELLAGFGPYGFRIFPDKGVAVFKLPIPLDQAIRAVKALHQLWNKG